MQYLLSLLDVSVVVTYVWTPVRMCDWSLLWVFLAAQQPDYEKLLLESELFLSAGEHTWKKLLSVWKISATYQPGRYSENPFLAFPWVLSQRIIHLTASTYTHTHRKFVLVHACSAVFHMVSPIDSTLMVVTQLWSMCSYQYFSLCLCVSISTLPQVSINKRQISGQLSFNLLSSISLTWMNVNCKHALTYGLTVKICEIALFVFSALHHSLFLLF